MSWNISKFDSNDALIIQLAEKIIADLEAAIAERGRASMAVSGGSTPKSLFSRLASSELDWNKVVITLVDERWLPPSHEDANAKLARDFLLQDKASAAAFVPMKTEHEDPFDAEAEVQERLRQLPLPFDVVILGMGGDGHTASFFPGADTLARAIDPEG